MIETLTYLYNTVYYVLGEDEGDEVAKMHCFRGGTPTGVEVKRLPFFDGVQDQVEVSVGEEDASTKEVMN